MRATTELIAELRLIVGYLGEKDQACWWESGFLSNSTKTFLQPIFNRSLWLAQFCGVTAAAARVHDDGIGVGCTYHVFRLPIHLEQVIADVVREQAFCEKIQAAILSKESALSRLQEIAGGTKTGSYGPVLLGDMTGDLSCQVIEAAGIYFSAFVSNEKSLPYIKEVA